MVDSLQTSELSWNRKQRVLSALKKICEDADRCNVLPADPFWRMKLLKTGPRGQKEVLNPEEVSRILCGGNADSVDLCIDMMLELAGRKSEIRLEEGETVITMDDMVTAEKKRLSGYDPDAKSFVIPDNTSLRMLLDCIYEKCYFSPVTGRKRRAVKVVDLDEWTLHGSHVR